MHRRDFLKLTGTCTGGLLLLPDFLHVFGKNENPVVQGNCLVFIQLAGGNDGLNTFIPYQDSLYYHYRTKIAVARDRVLHVGNGMGFHPALRGLAAIQQQGALSVVQNVGYPQPDYSHFRSQEIWETASGANEYKTEGWLGRYLDARHHGHYHPVGGINLNTTDSLALKGIEPNALTVTNPKKLSVPGNVPNLQLSGNPQLDFVRKLSGTVTEGAELIQKALKNAPKSIEGYPATKLGAKLDWIAKLIKGKLNSSVYYTSLSGFDTHNDQIGAHAEKLQELDTAIFSFYNDLKQSGMLDHVTLVVFSEFGRRVADNGNGTDHGTAAPMFIIGGANKGNITGSNPNLSALSRGDLVYETDFRSVYATLLKDKLDFDPVQIGISNSRLPGIF